MKKQASYLWMSVVLVLSACNAATQGGVTQAEIDSMANVKTSEMQAQKAARNDSIINAAARIKADSIEATQRAAENAAKAAAKSNAANAKKGDPTSVPKTGDKPAMPGTITK